MGVYDYLKNAATSFLAPPKKQPKNPENIDEGDMLNPQGPYKDVNKDGPDPLLKPKRIGVHLLNPAKDAGRDISKNKHGHYVATMTYPLPPLSWEKKQFELNRRKRNSGNKYL